MSMKRSNTVQATGKWLTLSLAVVVLLGVSSASTAQSLRGSRDSIDSQNRLAVSYGYAFVETARAMSQLVNAGELVRVTDTRHMELHMVIAPACL